MLNIRVACSSYEGLDTESIVLRLGTKSTVLRLGRDMALRLRRDMALRLVQRLDTESTTLSLGQSQRKFFPEPGLESASHRSRLQLPDNSAIPCRYDSDSIWESGTRTDARGK